MEEKYYRVLGVTPSTTLDEFKKVYKQLVRKYHPDVYRGSEQNKFLEIQEAYEKLKPVFESGVKPLILTHTDLFNIVMV